LTNGLLGSGTLRMPTRPTTAGSMPAPLISLPIHSTISPSMVSNGRRAIRVFATLSRRSSVAAKKSAGSALVHAADFN
jgi:hypothetical protein